MKRKIFIIITAFGLFFAGSTLAHSQVVIRVKPIKPKVIIVKHNRPSKRHIWIAGHWKWNKRVKKYVWIKGKWVRTKRGHIWTSGYWKKVPGGFKWIPGHWSRQ